jgi:hypothetical protein
MQKHSLNTEVPRYMKDWDIGKSNISTAAHELGHR